MERHNRKSYLAPPAPKSLKEEPPRVNTVPKPPLSKPPSRTQQPSYQPSNCTPKSGEIPLNIANDAPGYRHYNIPSNTSSSHHSGSTRSPAPPLSLEHLSLESNDYDYPSSRRPSRPQMGDPSSAVEAGQRPSFGSRSSSSYSSRSSRPGIQTANLPIRTAPPPNGPPQAPMSAGGTWRGQTNQMRNEI